mgnify:CR=1 FL=1
MLGSFKENIDGEKQFIEGMARTVSRLGGGVEEEKSIKRFQDKVVVARFEGQVVWYAKEDKRKGCFDEGIGVRDGKDKGGCGYEDCLKRYYNKRA